MRRWLAALVAATTSLVLIALLVPLALLVRAVAENGAVGRATGEAELVAVVAGSVDRDALALTVARATQAGGHPITVFLPDGTTVGSPAPRSPAVELAARGRSFSAAAPGGREILVAVQGGPGGTSVVRAFLSEADLTRGVYETWLGMLALGLALIGIGIAVADRLALRVTRPMTATAGVSHRLAAGDLSARAEVPDGPPEARATALALNHLAGRIGELLDEERENVADLSHRLRTPLTGLRLDAESLRDPEEAARIGARADDLERAVTAVIGQARRRSGGRQRCDAAEVVAERAAFWSALAEDQDRRMDLDLHPGPLPVALGAEELAACVDALLGNVFAHTPEGTPLSVRLAPGVTLEVADEGPGFPAGRLERGSSGAGSTGLGLDIARRTAEAAGGGLTLGSGPGGRGARVTVVLAPLAPS
ncbi:signal transduction histidine kinase [Thermocatellispora tengchongensis]|uniref:Signal transduction histidine-protein kinase/phosphatase MprB n=1 Tax=Thermocatellispora tengchongensis TaxID=1073253 RepID=A0A840P3M5_9ACTN|nr:HAMP domain-containing sensor histidine kinase [Thermocatellispora tengchongensis]MBB5133106.1 signal transduction histidine kinase [Thermocatellispora tengchongensis]